jgi:hypothetical protein
MGLVITVFSLILFINSVALIGVALFKLEEIEASLTNSKLVIDAARGWRDKGILGRQMRVAAALSSVLLSSFWIKRGFVDPEDVRQMPCHLKCWLLIPAFLGGVSLFSLWGLLLIAEKI